MHHRATEHSVLSSRLKNKIDSRSTLVRICSYPQHLRLELTSPFQSKGPFEDNATRHEDFSRSQRPQLSLTSQHRTILHRMGRNIRANFKRTLRGAQHRRRHHRRHQQWHDLRARPRQCQRAASSRQRRVSPMLRISTMSRGLDHRSRVSTLGGRLRRGRQIVRVVERMGMILRRCLRRHMASRNRSRSSRWLLSHLGRRRRSLQSLHHLRRRGRFISRWFVLSDFELELGLFVLIYALIFLGIR